MNDIQFGEGTFDDLYGHKIIELKENFIRTEIKITSNLHQPMGLVHGGTLFFYGRSRYFLCCVLYSGWCTWVGVNNNTDFLKSSKEGFISECTASPLKLGKRSQLWEAKIYNGDNLCAISKVRLSNLNA